MECEEKVNAYEQLEAYKPQNMNVTEILRGVQQRIHVDFEPNTLVVLSVLFTKE